MQRNLLIVPLLAVAVMMVTAGCTPGPAANETETVDATETLTEAPTETPLEETETPLEETETPSMNETETPTETPT